MVQDNLTIKQIDLTIKQIITLGLQGWSEVFLPTERTYGTRCNMKALAPVCGSKERENQKGRGSATPAKGAFRAGGKSLNSLDEESDLLSPLGRASGSRATETLMKSPGLETAETSERCRVLLRLRPLPESEGGASPLVITGRSVEVLSRDGTQVDDVASFPFDHLFPQDTTQVRTPPRALSPSVFHTRSANADSCIEWSCLSTLPERSKGSSSEG